MKNIFSYLVLLAISIHFGGCSSQSNNNQKPTPQQQLLHDTLRLEAPFKMPALVVPSFANTKVLSILDFGATPNTPIDSALKQAINKANSMGGATINIPAGVWKTGPIHYKSNVNLHLSEGAKLLFLPNPKLYLPAVKTTWEGMECMNYSPLIYAYQCNNIALTGKGKL